MLCRDVRCRAVPWGDDLLYMNNEIVVLCSRVGGRGVQCGEVR